MKKGIYKHYKGNLYKVIGIGKKEDDLEDYVIYKALYDINEFGEKFRKEPIFLRKIDIFEEEIEVDSKKIKRFEFVDDLKERPKVGIGVCIVKNKKVLLGKRKNAHGEGSWSPPGGHLEYGEEIEECAKRETIEETGLEVKNLKIVSTTNDIFEKEKKHYITIVVMCELKDESLDAKVLEPDKMVEWRWFEWDNLPSPLFLPLENLIKEGKNPFD